MYCHIGNMYGSITPDIGAYISYIIFLYETAKPLQPKATLATKKSEHQKSSMSIQVFRRELTLLICTKYKTSIFDERI